MSEYLFQSHKQTNNEKVNFSTDFSADVVCLGLRKIDEIDMRDTIRRDGFTKELYMRVIKETQKGCRNVFSKPIERS